MKDLDTLLTHRSPPIAELTRDLTTLIGVLRPEMEARVRTGWGTVNFHHPVAGFVVAVYPSADHVSVIYQQGRMLSSPLLVGDHTVKQMRWIPLEPGEEIPEDEIAILLAEAIALRS